MITNITELPRRARNATIKTIIGSMNQSIIGYARIAVRQEEKPTNSIDDYNDDKASNLEADTRLPLAEMSGVTLPFDAKDVTQGMVQIRNWLEGVILNDSPTKFDLPFRVCDSMQYQIDRAPRDNDTELKALAKAHDIPLAKLQEVQLKTTSDEHGELIRVRPLVLDLVASFGGQDLDAIETERIFEQLPIHLQYKIAVRALETINKQYDTTIVLFLNPRQRGHSDASTDLKLIEAIRHDLHTELVHFDKTHTAELDAYIDRGGNLPAIPNIVAEAIAA